MFVSCSGECLKDGVSQSIFIMLHVPFYLRTHVVSQDRRINRIEVTQNGVVLSVELFHAPVFLLQAG